MSQTRRRTRARKRALRDEEAAYRASLEPDADEGDGGAMDGSALDWADSLSWERGRKDGEPFGLWVGRYFEEATRGVVR